VYELSHSLLEWKMEIARAISSMLKLRFYKQRGKNILDGEIYTTISFRIKNLKAYQVAKRKRAK
jgi:hypothetical protein